MSYTFKKTQDIQNKDEISKFNILLWDPLIFR